MLTSGEDVQWFLPDYNMLRIHKIVFYIRDLIFRETYYTMVLEK